MVKEMAIGKSIFSSNILINKCFKKANEYMWKRIKSNTYPDGHPFNDDRFAQNIYEHRHTFSILLNKYFRGA